MLAGATRRVMAHDTTTVWRMTNDDTPRHDIPLREVATRLGVSVRTLQRREDQLEAVGSVKTGSGWRVPLDQVETLAKLLETTRATPTTTRQPRRTTRQDDDSRQDAPRHDKNVSHERCRDELSEVRVELAKYRALADERASTIDDLRSQIASLTTTMHEAVSSTTAATLTLRETTQRIENSRVYPSAGDNEREPAQSSRNEGRRGAGDMIRSRLGRFFG